MEKPRNDPGRFRLGAPPLFVSRQGGKRTAFSLAFGHGPSRTPRLGPDPAVRDADGYGLFPIGHRRRAHYHRHGGGARSANRLFLVL